MECPFCRYQIEEVEKFCAGCGKELPKIIKEQINKESREALKEIQTPHSISTPPHEISSKNKKETDVLSYETDDIRKKEYKGLVREAFEDHSITADEYQKLERKRRELGLDNNDIEIIHHDVSNELGFDIQDAGDLLSSIILEINQNKLHIAGDFSNLEIRITNVSDTDLEKVCVYGNIPHFNHFVEKKIGKLKKNGKSGVILPFRSQQPGEINMELFLEYFDAQGNPSVYGTNIPIKIRKQELSSSNVFNIKNEVVFQSDRQNVVDAEKMINFGNLGEIMHKDEPIEKSSYLSERAWVRWCLFFNEEETIRKRDSLAIQKKTKEGEKKYQEGLTFKREADGMDKYSAISTYKISFECLQESKECFTKILQTDPNNAFSLKASSLEKINEIGRVIAEIVSKIGILEKVSTAPAVKLSSGCLTISDLNRVYLFSKERISLGRDNKNDIVLRIIPCKPKEQYPENWQKSWEISSTHAEILNRAEQFYIKDIGSDGKGSLNGTFLNGGRIKPLQEYPIRDGMRINIARVLDLECSFLGEYKKREKESGTLSSCYTVLGEMADSCFGIDKVVSIDAIKIRRRNNYTEGEEYIILIREIRIGRSKSNGIAIDDEKVSDIHARLFYRDNQYWLEDLNSRHGTWVNGKNIIQGDEAPLGIRSDIKLGDAQLHFEGYE